MRKIQILAEELARVPQNTEMLYTAIMAAVLDERDRCAKLAENPAMIDRIGGSTGNAYGTAQRIARAIREEPKG